MKPAEIQRLTTTHMLSALTGRHHGAIQRLVAIRRLVPLAFLIEGRREVPLFDPADAGLVAALLDSDSSYIDKK